MLFLEGVSGRFDALRETHRVESHIPILER